MRLPLRDDMPFAYPRKGLDRSTNHVKSNYVSLHPRNGLSSKFAFNTIFKSLPTKDLFSVIERQYGIPTRIPIQIHQDYAMDLNWEWVTFERILC